ncbi:MAG: RNase adapter RapZ [Comamonadaceae bacterium]|nr:MAG: RNase adapter RapZ [Comamonadaceae bacterium]
MVLITGMSGSGKSVALHALEDTGYYCVDNLPPELLAPFVALQQTGQAGAFAASAAASNGRDTLPVMNPPRKVAIAIDVRSATSLPLVPSLLRQLRAQGVAVQSLFLDANTETLVRRFSETRRLHPLSRVDASDQHRALVDAIELERELLGDMREQAHILDTSMIRSSQLQGYVKSLISAPTDQLTLVFESFAFKRGVPMDADYVFDVRMLPNPHYETALRHQTGLDAPVADYLSAHAEVDDMFGHIEQFIGHWLTALVRDHRSYVTVAIGCTGGQHRSVYMVERLVQAFGARWKTLTRHRELDAQKFDKDAAKAKPR